MKPTVGQIFALSLLGLVTILGLLFYLVFERSRSTLLESSERLRQTVSHETGERVRSFLAKAPNAVHQVQVALDHGLMDPNAENTIEPALFAPLLANQEITEVTLTYGKQTGFAPDGSIRLAPSPRGQWSVRRMLGSKNGEQFWSRHVHQENGTFVADRRDFGHTPRFVEQPARRENGEIPDPTIHNTFATPANQEYYGQLLASDLHWSQIDADLPKPERRVEVSVQQVVTDANGAFVGVLRVGLLTSQLDEAIAGLKVEAHRIFLCDSAGRLVTRLAPGDRVQEFDDALRIQPENMPPEVARALADPALHGINDEAMGPVSGHFQQSSEEFLTTFRYLPGTQDWIVGIVVPRSYYLGALTAQRNKLLAFSLAIMISLIAGGTLILRSVKRALAQIAHEGMKMNQFEFSPAPTGSTFRDISSVLECLEQAKTAMRAMGKYVPVDLVRRLYLQRSEPVLGGQDIDISVMFTDIKDFTTFSEELPPNRLADALGRYLDVMARIIQQETRGTIDKYIGDAIMTIWNAPELVADHSQMACTAALRCREAAHALSTSPAWEGLPPFETRFGLHRGEALVGHFGAHDRMNYTAIGDAINLASRLEGLNKEYGTSIIASEAIVELSREHFEFRLLDLVAVKGKHRAVRIYELLGRKGEANLRTERIAKYERAFAAYLARDFAGALVLLEERNGDRPSAVLAERCRAFVEEPPPHDWIGIHVATRK